MGQRRILLSTQIDDVFLSTGLYNVKEKKQSEGETEIYRNTATDFDKLVAFQFLLRAEMP
eukprot:Awhi_evm1s12133